MLTEPIRLYYLLKIEKLATYTVAMDGYYTAGIFHNQLTVFQLRSETNS